MTYMAPHNLIVFILKPPYLVLPFFCSSQNTGLLSANISRLFIPQGFCTAFICLECLFAWLFPFHLFLERPTLTTLMLLSSSPRNICSKLFDFYPNTYHSLKYSYIYGLSSSLLCSEQYP